MQLFTIFFEVQKAGGFDKVKKMAKDLYIRKKNTIFAAEFKNRIRKHTERLKKQPQTA